MSKYFSRKATSKTDENESEDNSPEICEVFLDGNLKNAEVVDEHTKSFGIFMHSLILSNRSQILKSKDDKLEVIGDENERAISFYTLRRGFDKNLFNTIAPMINELDGNYRDNLKPTVHRINEKLRIVEKGSPVDLLQRCSHVIIDSKLTKLTRRLLREINEAFWTMVGKGLKVYAIAIKDITELSDTFKKDDKMTFDMTFVALIGIGRI